MKFKWFVGVDFSKKTLYVTLFDKMALKKSPHIVVL